MPVMSPREVAKMFWGDIKKESLGSLEELAKLYPGKEGFPSHYESELKIAQERLKSPRTAGHRSIPDMIRRVYDIPSEVKNVKQALRYMILQGHSEAGTTPRLIKAHHGTYDPDMIENLGPNLHAGTEQSSKDRLRDRRYDAGENTPENEIIHQLMIEPKKMSRVLPDSVANMATRHPDDILWSLIHYPHSERSLDEHLKMLADAEKADLIPYVNYAEDPGSISYVVKDPKNIKRVKTQRGGFSEPDNPRKYSEEKEPTQGGYTPQSEELKAQKTMDDLHSWVDKNKYDYKMDPEEEGTWLTPKVQKKRPLANSLQDYVDLLNTTVNGPKQDQFDNLINEISDRGLLNRFQYDGASGKYIIKPGSENHIINDNYTDSFGATMAGGGVRKKVEPELRNTRRSTSELRNTPNPSFRERLADMVGDTVDNIANLGRGNEKILDYPGLDEKIRSLGDKIGIGHGEGKGFLESFIEPLAPNTPLDVAMMAGGAPKGAVKGVEALASGVPFFERALKMGEKMGVEDATKFADTMVALRKRLRKGEKIDLGSLDSEAKDLLTSGLQRIKGTAPRAQGTAPNSPPIVPGQDTYFKMTRSGNLIHVGQNAPNLKEGEALILQTRNGEKIVAEGNLTSRQKSTLDSTDLNSLKPQSYPKRYSSWLDEANKHFQGVKGTDVKPLGEKDGALLVEFPNPEGGKWTGTIRNGKLTSAAHLDTPLKDAKGLIDPSKPAGTDILRMVKAEGEAGKDVELLKEHLYKQNPMASGPQTPGFQKSVSRYKEKQMGGSSPQNQTGIPSQTPTGQGQVPAQSSQVRGSRQSAAQNAQVGSTSATNSSGSGAPIPPSGSGNLPPGGRGGNRGSAQGSATPSQHPVADVARNVLGTFKTLKSMIDLPVGRHAIVEALAHPVEVGGPSLKAGLEATFSPARHQEIQMDALHSLGNMTNDLTDRLVGGGFDVGEASKLADKTLGKLNLNDLLQQFPSTYPEKIPGLGRLVKASERGYSSSLNTARTNRLGQMLRKHPDASLDDVSGMVNMVNDFTGAGDLGRLEPVADLLASGMFSPRLLSSRAAMLNPVNYMRNKGSNLGLLKTGTKWGSVGKREALKDMSKFAGVGAGGLGAIAALGGDVEIDPRSSDFLSPKVGDTTFDFGGGMKPLVNSTARMITGKTKRPWGEIVNQPRGKTATQFMRSKLSPGPPSMLGDLIFGEDKHGVARDLSGDPVIDNPKDFAKWVGNQVAPMWPVDVAQAFSESGPLAGALTVGLGSTGVGSQTYPRKKKDKKSKSLEKKDGIVD